MINESIVEKGLAVLLRPDFADGAPCAETFYRYASGDMTEGERGQFEAHLEECDVCRGDLGRLSELGGSEAPHLHPARHRRIVTAAASMAAMIAVALVWQLALQEESRPREEGAHVFRPKSGYKIQVAVERKGRQFAANSGDDFETGDLLGFFYTAPAETWPVILYSDDKGHIERIFPKGQPVSMPAGVEKPLPVSAVLEAGEGCEWIAAFFSEASPNLKRIESALKRAVLGQREDCVLKQIRVPNTSIEVITLKRKPTAQ
jgi:hypothetical protein